MKIENLFLSVLALSCVSCTDTVTNVTPVDYVNPLVGTDNWHGQVPIAGGEEPSGYTFPLVTEPFGMTAWTAHTMPSKDKGTLHNRVPYWYKHKYISGFLGTHYPSGAVMFDYGAVELMPMTGTLKYRPEERSSSYKHESETVKANKYAVTLDDYGIKAEMSATKAASVMDFYFPQSDSSYVLVDAMPSLFTCGIPSEIQIDPEKREIRGRCGGSARAYRESGYFVVRFDKDFSSYGTFNQNLDYPEVIEEKYLFTEKDGKLVNGLTATYQQDSEAFGHLESTRIDPVVDFDWDWYKPADDFYIFDNYSATWKGKLKAPTTGKYLLGLQADDGARLYIDGKLIIDDWEKHFFSYTPKQAEIELEAGKMYDIKVDYYQTDRYADIKLSWVRPDDMSQKGLIAGNKQLASSSKIGAYIGFATKANERVRAVVGTSFISMDQAAKNLEREIGKKDVAQVSEELAAKWNQELGKIELPGTSANQKGTFYTALFHGLLLPRSLEEDGRYRSPFDSKVYEGKSFTDYSIWDTFRAVHPMLVILKPELCGDLITGLLNGFKEGGWMPKWPNPGYTNCMLGTHGDAVIADAYVKGVENFDVELAEKAMMKDAYEKGDYMYWGRLGIKEFLKNGYVPTDKYNESVARTMEFSYDDFCIAQFLKKKGNRDEKVEEFTKRSLNFKNVLDPETKMVRGKTSDGKWCDPLDYRISVWTAFNPLGALNYKMNYTLFVPHAVPELIEFLGGNDKLAAFLDKIFDEEMYYVGDEFAMHAPYMYNYCGQAWKTQKIVNKIVNYYYLNQPDGLPGNDDCGQLSAWYAFSTLGFYPVCPGSTKYQITSPNVPEAVINLDNGKKFTIKTVNFGKDNIYIKSVTMNGKPLEKPEIDHADIVNGGVLEYVLDSVPNKELFN